MLISKVFTIFLTVLVSSAIAAPVLKERSFDDLQISERSVFAHAKQIMRDIHRHLKPQPGKAIFWSGTKPGKNGPVSVHKDAQRFAKLHKKVVLSAALAKVGIKIPSIARNPYSHRLWQYASKKYAQRASGYTHAILGPTRRPGNVYDTIEKPALLENSKVPKLTEHTAGTGESTVVK